MQKTFRLIKPNKWYIVDTFRMSMEKKPYMLKKEFDNYKQAKMNIDKFFPGQLRFGILRGSRAMELEVPIMNRFPELRVYLQKYRYAPDMISLQDRKSYRTRFRRNNRRGRGDLNGQWG